MQISKTLFVALIVLNAAILGMLVADRINYQKPLQAQEVQTAVGDYAMYANIMDSEIGNLYVIDARLKRMACYRWDRSGDRMIIFEVRYLVQDFSTVGRAK